jgi:hypothetical protein
MILAFLGKKVARFKDILFLELAENTGCRSNQSIPSSGFQIRMIDTVECKPTKKEVNSVKMNIHLRD